MNINLDEKKIKNIVYLTRNGRPVNLVLKNGELVDVTDIPVRDSGSKNDTEVLQSGNKVKIAKKLIDLDKDGTLDEIAKEHTFEIGKKLKKDIEVNDSETQYDIDVCTKSMTEIEKKALDVIKNSECEKKKELLDELMREYEKYRKIKNDLRDKLWDIRCKK